MSFTRLQVEEAVRAMHPGVDQTTFRSRARRLQRYGAIPSADGKGLRRSYDDVDALHWALCFEFLRLGFSLGKVGEWSDQIARCAARAMDAIRACAPPERIVAAGEGAIVVSVDAAAIWKQMSEIAHSINEQKRACE